MTIRCAYSDIYQMTYWYIWFSWWWALGCLKYVEKWNKLRKVCQVDYQQELRWDAQSTKYKILKVLCLMPCETSLPAKCVSVVRFSIGTAVSVSVSGFEGTLRSTSSRKPVCLYWQATYSKGNYVLVSTALWQRNEMYGIVRCRQGWHIQGGTGGMDQTSGGCSLC